MIFTRYPVPGRAKTRLIPVLGAEKAARLQRRMTEHTILVARAVAARGVSVEVRYDGASARVLRRWLGGNLSFREQGRGGLGDRLERAARAAFAQGEGRVVIIGCDCPELDSARILNAFSALAHSDLVAGPARDGGYYLIGSNKHTPELFEGIAWGGEKVLAETLRKARSASLRATLLPELSDVDVPGDLPIWEGVDRASSTLSVIIPSLNEADYIDRTLQAVQEESPAEVIVADGGSGDGTRDKAERSGARLLRVERGRGCQMQTGALAATSENLFFLHADTLPPKGYREAIVRALRCADVSLGAFRFGIKEEMSFRGWVEGLVALRCFVLRNPFGDQGLFVRRELFNAVGGFPDWPILEDVELVRRLKRFGRLHLDSLSVATSGRRWRERGIVRTFWANLRIMLAFHAGVSLERLARMER